MKGRNKFLGSARHLCQFFQSHAAEVVYRLWEGLGEFELFVDWMSAGQHVQTIDCTGTLPCEGFRLKRPTLLKLT